MIATKRRSWLDDHLADATFDRLASSVRGNRGHAEILNKSF